MNQILVHEKIIVTPEFRRKRKIYKCNFFLSIFFICTLFSCYIYAEYDRNKSEQVSQEILSSLEENMQGQDDETTIAQNNDVLVVSIADDEEQGIVDLSDIVVNNNQQQETVQGEIVETTAKDGTRYYTESILRIESLGIEYPVLSETSEELLKISLNRLWGPDPNEVGNYVIVGHNYKSGKMFGNLAQISIGDTFTLEDNSKRILTYQVYDRYIVDPTDVACTSQMTNGRKEVTLITCQNSGKKRLVVKAHEV